jgi:lipopolysaccharide heptosyltransferase II
MNILIIFSNRLGDTVMGFPFVQGVKQAFPNSRIYAVVSKELVELMALVPEFDGVFAKVRNSYPSIVGNVQTASALRKSRKYDLCICLSDSFSTALIAFLAGIKIRIGHNTDGRGFLLSHSINYEQKKESLVFYSFNLLNKYLNKVIEPQPYRMKFTSKGQRILPEGKNLVFNINSLGKSKIIPTWKAAAMVEGLLGRYDYNIILIGAEYEFEAVGQVIEKLRDGQRVHNYAGKTDLVGLAHLLVEADLMISTDTGTAHLANAIGTKLIVLFGSGDSIKSRPFNNENLRVIDKGLPCSPCLLADCKFAEPLCLTEIENQDIFDAIDELVNT